MTIEWIKDPVKVNSRDPRVWSRIESSKWKLVSRKRSNRLRGDNFQKITFPILSWQTKQISILSRSMDINAYKKSVIRSSEVKWVCIIINQESILKNINLTIFCMCVQLRLVWQLSHNKEGFVTIWKSNIPHTRLKKEILNQYLNVKFTTRDQQHRLKNNKERMSMRNQKLNWVMVLIPI